MTDFKIKPELKDEWMRAVGKNACDPYSFGVVMATCRSFEVLDDPSKTPKDAVDTWAGLGLSGFIASASASWVSKFHRRGEEFRSFWNADNPGMEVQDSREVDGK